MQVTDVTGRTNGHARQSDVLKLGETIEERRPIELNGRTLWAWVTTNARYPTSVAAELDDARNRWLSARQPIDPTTTTPTMLWVAAEELADLVDQAEEDSEAIARAALEVARIVRELQEEPEMRSSEVEWQLYLTSALCSLVPGLERHDAELLGPQRRLLVLSELGYLGAPRTADEAAQSAENKGDEDAAEKTEGTPVSNPPDTGPSSIGDEPAPDSAASTD